MRSVFLLVVMAIMTQTVALEAEADAHTVPAAVEDKQLVRRAQEGDLSAFDALIRRYQERVYATVYHMTSNHEDANDLTQETFVKAYKALTSFKGDSGFFTRGSSCRDR